jgi:hypothetical protein
MLAELPPASVAGSVELARVEHKRYRFPAFAISMRRCALRRRKDHGQTTTRQSSRTDFGIETAVLVYETEALKCD